MNKLAISAVAGAMLFAGSAIAQDLNAPEKIEAQDTAQNEQLVLDLKKDPNETNWWWW